MFLRSGLYCFFIGVWARNRKVQVKCSSGGLFLRANKGWRSVRKWVIGTETEGPHRLLQEAGSLVFPKVAGQSYWYFVDKNLLIFNVMFYLLLDYRQTSKCWATGSSSVACLTCMPIQSYMANLPNNIFVMALFKCIKDSYCSLLTSITVTESFPRQFA